MRFIRAIFLPGAAFFKMGRPFTGIICILLQLTVIAWLPASIWAVYAVIQHTTNNTNKNATKNKNKNGANIKTNKLDNKIEEIPKNNA